MATVVEARRAYQDARDLVVQRRLALGRAIREARLQGLTQDAIADELDLTREQVRRLQREYEAKSGLVA